MCRVLSVVLVPGATAVAIAESGAITATAICPQVGPAELCSLLALKHENFTSESLTCRDTTVLGLADSLALAHTH